MLGGRRRREAAVRASGPAARLGAAPGSLGSRCSSQGTSWRPGWPANGRVLRLPRAFILWGRPQKARRPAPAPCPGNLAVMAAILSSKVQVQPAFVAKRAPVVQRRASVAVRAGAIAAEDVPTPEKRTIMVRERPGGAGRAPLHRPPARAAACSAPEARGWRLMGRPAPPPSSCDRRTCCCSALLVPRPSAWLAPSRCSSCPPGARGRPNSPERARGGVGGQRPRAPPSVSHTTTSGLRCGPPCLPPPAPPLRSPRALPFAPSAAWAAAAAARWPRTRSATTSSRPPGWRPTPPATAPSPRASRCAH